MCFMVVPAGCSMPRPLPPPCYSAVPLRRIHRSESKAGLRRLRTAGSGLDRRSYREELSADVILRFFGRGQLEAGMSLAIRSHDGEFVQAKETAERPVTADLSSFLFGWRLPVGEASDTAEAEVFLDFLEAMPSRAGGDEIRRALNGATHRTLHGQMQMRDALGFQFGMELFKGDFSHRLETQWV